MPEVSQHYKRQKLAATAGNAVLSGRDIASAVQPYQEIARGGRILTQFGLAAAEKLEQARYHDEFNNARVEANKTFYDLQQSIEENADTDTWMPSLEKAHTELEKRLKFTNQRARNDFTTWFENEKLVQKASLTSYRNRIDARNYEKNFNQQNKNLRAMAAGASESSDFVRGVQDGLQLYGVRLPEDADGRPIVDGERLELIEGWDNPLLDSDEVRMAGAKGWLSAVASDRQKVMGERAKISIEQQAFAMAERIKAERMAEGKGQSEAMAAAYSAAEKFLREPSTRKILIEQGVERNDAKSLLADIEDNVKDARAAEQEGLRQARQGLGNQIFKAIDEKRYSDARELINNGTDGVQLEPTGENSKTSWTDRLNTKIERGEKSDPFNEYDPETYFAISRRVNTEPEKVTESNLAALVGKGRDGGISTKQYESLLKILQDSKSGKLDSIKQKMASRYSGVVNKLQNGELFTGTQAEMVKKAADVQEMLDKWLLENPNASTEDFDKFFQTAVGSVDMEALIEFADRKSAEKISGIDFGWWRSEEDTQKARGSLRRKIMGENLTDEVLDFYLQRVDQSKVLGENEEAKRRNTIGAAKRLAQKDGYVVEGMGKGPYAPLLF